MSAFTREQRRFDCHGLQLTAAPDAVRPGKWPVIQNVRSYVQGTLQGREGLVAVAGVGASIHSLIQMNDPTSFASVPAKRFLGATGNLYAGVPAGPFPQVDNGYSGDPLTWAEVTPPQSPQPWLYVADRSRMRKTNVNGSVFPIGIDPPLISPVATLDPLYTTVIENFTTAFVPWIPAGVAAGPTSTINRINTTIAFFAFDIDEYGNTSGNAAVVPNSMDGIDVGTLITFDGTDVLPVQTVTIAVASTTIQSIIYDVGTSGLCTIQPAASLGVGQLEAPTVPHYQAKQGRYAVPRGPGVVGNPSHQPKNYPKKPLLDGPDPSLPPEPTTVSARIRQVDFPVNCLILLGSVHEVVKIISVALGKDGIQSFRCSTTGTFHAGDSIDGVAGFRVFANRLYAGGMTLTANALRNIITPIIPADPTVVPTAVGGIQTGPGWVPDSSLALINGRATLPEDDLRLCIRVNDCTMLKTVRVYFDVDASVHTFTQNYFFFEWRANDIVASIQASNTDPVATLQASRLTTVTNDQLNQRHPGSHGPAPPGAPIVGTAIPRSALANDALSTQLALGNNQWIELRCKIRELVHVGTDPARTLSNVAAAEILVSIEGVNAITVDYDALWLSGGYGPDAGDVNPPMSYFFRYRSSTTGARSNPSPVSRRGVVPRRQSITVKGVQCPDTQCDLVDWFRQGSGLDRPTYAGTTPNAASPTFTDVYSDSALSGGEGLDFTLFKPWPTQDRAQAGTCNVAGSAIQRVSGDNFNTKWAPGSVIIVNGQAYTLYAQPASTTLLTINENAGSGIGVPFTMPGPTLMGQNFATFWGGPIGGATFYFSCGDPINPGVLHWTNGNDSETASDANTLEVTTAADPLQNGFMYDGVAFVASAEEVFVLEPTFGAQSPFRALITPCGRGFWTRWAFATGAPEGVYFLGKDGIYLTAGGSPAVSITDLDLYPIFPHDGAPGVTVNGIKPPDMAQTNRLRLSYIDGWLYFDYVDTGGDGATLAFWTADKSWWFDRMTPTINTRWSAEGAQTHAALIGGTTGTLYTPGGATDAGAAIACHTQWVAHQGDARGQKLYRDVMIEGDLTGGSATVQLGFTNNSATLPAQPLVGVAGRAAYLINTTTKEGNYGTNLTIDLTWNPAVLGLPLFDVWDLAFQMEPELASSWLSGPTTHGLRGFQQVYMALIAYRSFGAVTFSLIIDGTTYTYINALPSSAGVYKKALIVLQSVKGMTFQYGAQSVAGCQIFDRDCEFWVQPWGAPGGYQQIRPF